MLEPNEPAGLPGPNTLLPVVEDPNDPKPPLFAKPAKPPPPPPEGEDDEALAKGFAGAAPPLPKLG